MFKVVDGHSLCNYLCVQRIRLKMEQKRKKLKGFDMYTSIINGVTYDCDLGGRIFLREDLLPSTKALGGL